MAWLGGDPDQAVDQLLIPRVSQGQYNLSTERNNI